MGIIVYKDVMSMVKMILFSPEKVILRKISSARSFQFLRFMRAVTPFLLWKGWRVWCCN